MSWEKEEKEKGMTRREWVQLGVGAATVASLAGLGGLVAGQILPPPYKMTGEVRDTIQYTKFPTPQWWERPSMCRTSSSGKGPRACGEACSRIRRTFQGPAIPA